MAKNARIVGQSNEGRFGVIAPINAQEFLDFFGQGTSKSNAHRTLTDDELSNVPDSVREYASNFLPTVRPTVISRMVENTGSHGTDGDGFSSRKVSLGERRETLREAAGRVASGTDQSRALLGDKRQVVDRDPENPSFSNDLRYVDPTRGTVYDSENRTDPSGRQLEAQTAARDLKILQKQDSSLIASAPNGSNTPTNPVWYQAYKAGLDEFYAKIADRDKKVKDREKQIKQRKERGDTEVGAGGGGLAPGTSLITAAQGSLSRTGSAARSLLR